MLPRESTTDGDQMTEDEGFDTDGLNGLADHEVRQLFVGPNALPYNGTKSIKQAYLFTLFKIINLIIANNIDPRQQRRRLAWIGRSL